MKGPKRIASVDSILFWPQVVEKGDFLIVLKRSSEHTLESFWLQLIHNNLGKSIFLPKN